MTQAVSALAYLTPEDPYYPIGLYQDHLFNHVVSRFLQNYDVYKYINPDILILAEHDREKTAWMREIV